MLEFLLQQGLSFIVGVASSIVVILLNVESITQRRRRRDRDRELSELRRFWGDGAVYNIICGIEDAVSEGEIEPRLGYAEAYGLTEIGRVLGDVFPGERRPTTRLTLLHESDRIDRHLFHENVIIFGGALSLTRFGALCEGLDLPYQAVYRTAFDRAIQRFDDNTPSTPIYQAAIDVASRKIGKDFGSVVRFLNPENGKLVVLYEGLYSAGLLAAVLLTTSKDKLRDSGFSAVTAANEAGLEVVVQIKDIVANQALVPEPNVVHASPWTAFRVERSTFSRAVDRASTP